MKNRGVGIMFDPKNRIALIKRVHNGEEYYVFPGGGIEIGESPEEATIREVKEELGLEVEIEKLLTIYDYQGIKQYYYYYYYYYVSVIGGEFGSGIGEEFNNIDKGTYTPLWIELDQINEINIKPKEVALEIIKNNNLHIKR